MTAANIHSYQLSVRELVQTGGVTDVQPIRDGAPDPLRDGRRLLTIFIHGFNNSSGKAFMSWTNTWNSLRPAVPDKYLRSFVEFYWPGDEHRSTLRSALAYSRQIPKALESAARLADYLRGSDRPIKVRFVGHSLGCRVVLETARLLEHDEHVNVEGFLLMAAAVAEGHCNKPEAYGRRLAKHEEILFSSKDRALGMVFEAGEWRGGDRPRSGRAAVGKGGRPVRRWRPHNPDTRLKHGQYWTAGVAVERMSAILSMEPAIPSHAMFLWDAPSYYGLGSWEVGTRRLRSPAETNPPFRRRVAA